MDRQFIPNPSLKGTDPIDALRLIRSEQVGPMTFFHLIKCCGSVKAALEMAPELSRRGGRKKPIALSPKSEAQKEYDALTAHGASVVLYGETAYPPLLQYIPDAPPLLTVKGHMHLLAGTRLIGIVGARNASTNGCNFARKLATDLGAAGYGVVSGLARGIDAAAHRGAIATGTLAVIGGGIDNIYPSENASLFSEITDSGIIISEQPFGKEPHARSFPGRNRIIAGMSQGLAVIEASLKSGSLITAEYATDYGRDVFAVPGSPMDPRCHGTNKLLKEGAILTESARDILGNLSQSGDRSFAEQQMRLFEEAAPTTMNEQQLTEARAAVLQCLSASPTLIDDVLNATGLAAQTLLVVLLELELAGRLERQSGGKVCLIMGE